MGWGQGGCEQRIEVCFFLGGGGFGLVGWGRGGCERRIEVFVKIQKNKKKLGGGGGRVGGGGGGSGWMRTKN